jgi:tetratricopeptide (TPR) repeat protein
VFLLLSAEVHAQTKATKAEKTEAARLKKEADGLMDQDRYVDALSLYARAYDLTSDPVLLYNQGRALEAMGDYAEALDKLERFDHDASPALRAKVPGLRDLIADLRGRIATLVVTTNAPSARLLVRDKAAGTIDKETRIRTRAGPATIEVVAEGYVTFKKDVDLAPGSVVKLDAQLSLRKADALIIVRTRPAADIAVDGKAIGRAPLEMHLPPGQHELVADAKGRETEHIPMTLALGDRRELDIELHEPPGLLTRWWFWTAVGVAVVGAGVGVYAAVTERDPTVGTFGAGNTTGP